MRPAIRLAGVLLALSTLAGAAASIWASGEDGRVYVRMGLAGALAVGLLWAGRARTAPRAAARGALVSGVLVAGAVAVFFSWISLTLGGDALLWLADLFPGAPHDEFAAQEEFQIVSWAVEWDTALSWGIDGCALVLAIGIAPMLRRQLTSGPAVRGDHRLMPMLPFALLGFAAFADHAVAAGVLALLAGVWLLAAVHVGGTRQAPGEPAAPPG